MKTLQEKSTFAAAAALYLLLHLRGGATTGEMLAGTVMQLLVTAPYGIGFTWILVRMIKYLHHGRKLAWDRVARIFFTIGIFFAFFFGLHEYAGQAEKARLQASPERSAAEAAAPLSGLPAESAAQ
ncbi:hypothetical protein [Candidatus Electronema sp. TJ]|uniref:hypothetical protein n=1 Tax=Candidatus Electronema sp. TJ TaxID=3401573 RepID=UPI003AA7F7C9